MNEDGPNGSPYGTLARHDQSETKRDTKGHQTIVALIHNLFHTIAEENTNINGHLNKLKSYWERIVQISDPDFHISDPLFIVIISSSLPTSWDTFTEPYVGGRRALLGQDPRKLTGSQEFIGLLKEEYTCRAARVKQDESTSQAMHGKHANQKGASNNTTKCGHCVCTNHVTKDCCLLKKSNLKCNECGKAGHLKKDCWNLKAKQGKREGEKPGEEKPSKKPKNETASATIVEVAEEIAFEVGGKETDKDVDMCLDVSGDGLIDEVGDDFTFDATDVSIVDVNDERVSYYDWLADCATTSHVSNQHKAFITYQPTNDTTIAGVGNVKTVVEGRGTVKLLTECEGQTYLLRLEDVLYVLSNHNNLLALGRWDAAGGSYTSDNGIMSLRKGDKTVAKGLRIKNNLYKLKVRVYSPRIGKGSNTSTLTFAATESTQSWETWHKRYGHISYGSLCTLYEKCLVSGFFIDKSSPMPDCEACTKAKLHKEPYNKSTDRHTEPGELTHIDLWGKYDVTSIHGHQYYIAFMDDAVHYLTVEFLKGKNEAAQRVKEYFMHLKIHNKTPKYMQIDRGKEFVNTALQSWCQEQGIDIQMTAPYSLSQNSAAERVNRTLVELV
jgi:hypothetical protein